MSACFSYGLAAGAPIYVSSAGALQFVYPPAMAAIWSLGLTPAIWLLAKVTAVVAQGPGLESGKTGRMAPVGQVPMHRPQLVHSVSSNEPPSAGRTVVAKPRLTKP